MTHHDARTSTHDTSNHGGCNAIHSPHCGPSISKQQLPKSAKRKRVFYPLLCVLALVLPNAARAQGSLTNGVNQEGSIAVTNEVDDWTFEADAGDFVTVRLGETDNGSGFHPYIQLRGPDDALLASDHAPADGLVAITAAETGTYSLQVADYDTGAGDQNDDTGSYRLELAKIPGAFTVATGDDGGALTNGANHFGDIHVGDIDMWTFQAASNDFVTIRLGETDNGSGFNPYIDLRGPAGAQIGWDTAAQEGLVSMTAPETGTYTVRVLDYDTGAGDQNDDTGSYRLELAKIPGAFTVAPGDDGGALTNGANHFADIHVGDIDMWTFDAESNSFVTVRLGETDNGSGFYPYIDLRGPAGAQIDWDTAAQEGFVSMTAPETGTYTVRVLDYDTGAGDENDDTGSYRLELAKVPGAFTVAPGDDGGALTNGANHFGGIYAGDVDLWSVELEVDDYVRLKLGETDDGTGFQPWLGLYGPDGTLLANDSAPTIAQVSHVAQSTGTYTFWVEDSSAGGNNDTGSYRLEMVKIPGAFVVETNDQGGVITNDTTYSGDIHVGDLDRWVIDLVDGENVWLEVDETDDGTGFQPTLSLFAPDGTPLATNSTSSSAQISYIANTNGTFIFVVSDADAGSGSYELKLLEQSHYAHLIDFETIPGGVPLDGMTISNQFESSAGVLFSLEGGGYPVLAEVGNPTTAFAPNDTPLPDQGIGSFFLTDDGLTSGLESPALLITYTIPTASASGVILDMDLDESFNIQAFDASTNLLGELTINAGDPNTGDAVATPWSINQPTASIHMLRLKGTRTASGFFGLGFDNFNASGLPWLYIRHIPPASSEVELSWVSRSNILYQLESCTNLIDAVWTNNMTAVFGTGTTNFSTNSVSPGPSERYYRLRIVD